MALLVDEKLCRISAAYPSVELFYRLLGRNGVYEFSPLKLNNVKKLSRVTNYPFSITQLTCWITVSKQ